MCIVCKTPTKSTEVSFHAQLEVKRAKEPKLSTFSFPTSQRMTDGNSDT